jgi:divalent metal cation (Fe/Co/Zn/Cd) transporter
MIQVTSLENTTRLRRQALRLEWFTIGYNVLEGLVALVLGGIASSIALVGFGLDSGVEVLAAVVLLWRLTRKERDEEHAARLERRAVLLVGLSFWVLGTYISWQSIDKLLSGEQPQVSWGGIGLALLSLLVMPWLARQKRKVAVQLDSRALSSESAQTEICAYLSAVLLGGLLLNALFGWWWADPVVSLGIVALMLKEGWENIEVWRGRKECGCSCGSALESAMNVKERL